MCLYPKLIKNRKYTATKKNGGVIPPLNDKRVLAVPIGCQKCMECKKKKAREWRVRLMEDIRHNKKAQFVTMTFSTEALKKIIADGNIEKTGYELDNEICTKAVRYFTERWRKEYGKAPRHWLVTELGTGRYEHVHIHGVIYGEKEAIKKHWKQYGFVYLGKYVNEKTCNYITKYITKTDFHHKEYTPIVLCSKGIGKNYTERHDAQLNKYKPNGKTDESYTARNGHKMLLPIYWRNKIYTEDEKELLWLEKLDKEERWVDGEQISVRHDTKMYWKHIREARIKSKKLGYGDNKKNWEQKEYENQRRELIYADRIKNENFNRMEETKNSAGPRGIFLTSSSPHKVRGKTLFIPHTTHPSADGRVWRETGTTNVKKEWKDAF